MRQCAPQKSVHDSLLCCCTADRQSFTVQQQLINLQGALVSQENLKQLLAADMDAVDQVIRTRLHSDVALVSQVGEYIVNSGGKRLRPALVVLSAQAFGYAGTSHHDLAAVVEFIHTATLLHDDVVDDSALRRGQATASALFGNSASVLVGDFLYSRAFQMMVEVGDMRVMQTLADATNIIAEGEVLQLLNCHDASVSAENYLRVIYCKTAKLFEAAMRLGAILSKVDHASEQAVAQYGVHLGTAFQLVDDVLDYSGDAQEIGKNLGDDLAEGKPTLPLIYAMQHGTAAQAALVRSAIEQGDLALFDEVLQVVQQTGALEYTRQQAQREADAACAVLAALPDTQYKKSLMELAEFAASRKF
jgi:octaprenyl-diphosphate synthase